LSQLVSHQTHEVLSFESQPYTGHAERFIRVNSSRTVIQQVTNRLVLVVKRTNELVCFSALRQESEPTNRERRIAMEGQEKPLSLHAPKALYTI